MVDRRAKGEAWRNWDVRLGQKKRQASARKRTVEWRSRRTPERVHRDRQDNATRTRAWGKTEHGRRRKKTWTLKKLYGITLEDFERMVVEQNGQCLICLVELDLGFNTAIDHDHDTGIIRGLLCSRCNLALGGFKDNVEILRRAVSYLEKEGTNP